MSTELQIIFVMLITTGAFALGFSIGHSVGRDSGVELGKAQGWVDRGLDDWKKDLAKRNKQGRFK